MKGGGCFRFAGFAGSSDGVSGAFSSGELGSGVAVVLSAVGEASSVGEFNGLEEGVAASDTVSVRALSSDASGGGLGASNGPSQPSCNPRMYSFHVFLPMTRSPATPSNVRIPTLSRRAFTTVSTSPSSRGSLVCSPCIFRNFLILSANPARTSPSLLPSTTSQSSPEATSTGLTYSWKWSRADIKPSAGGAERYIEILRGILETGRGSLAICDTKVHHFCCTFFFCRLSYTTAVVHEPTTVRNIIQLREGSLRRKFGSPSTCELVLERSRRHSTYPSS